MSARFMEKVQNLFINLPRQEKKVARVTLQKPELVRQMNITELATQAGVGVATVSRFTKRVGCKNFADFKLALVTPDTVQRTSNEKMSTPLDIYNYYQKILSETMAMVSTKQLHQAANLIHDAERVYVFGIGSSGYNAQEFAQRILRMGKPAFAMTESNMMTIASATMNQNDLVIALSVSGSTPEVCSAVRDSRKNQATIIAVTAFKNSVLGKMSDLLFQIKSTELVGDYDFINSQFAVTYVIDMLTQILLQFADFRKTMDKTVESILVTKEQTAIRGHRRSNHN
ncbi:MurR/RpiR family transcriptional regulator [uncultured Limosilactobacillus sp.]|uniref:MurR/RpiR family transcriptional regulator n=1 Tax=uncultured Limosilactobacillus sp. TaxID=2837629 RepID=UPI0025FB74E9|nr:MurR/RpiR family transcriptional regulator [uncultured Limosilactobacillus sp.]